MFITFYTNKKPQQITFEEILKNTRLQETQKTFDAIKVTKELKEGEWTIPKALTESTGLKILSEDFNTEEHYKHFQIPKKSNPKKKRKIDAPDDELKAIQREYKLYIEKGLAVLPHKAAHAYVEGCSTVTAMKVHQANNSKWFLQLDLKNFFNSITKEWLDKMLQMVFPLNHLKELEEDLYNSILKSALLNGVLPQGSVLSPTLTNICMVPIDYRITEALKDYKRHNFIYTRYADDMTISCKEKFNPEEIIEIIESIFRGFEVPFTINSEKTRFGSVAGKNYHVGIILNKDGKLSVGHEKNNKFRAMIFNFCQVGEEWDRHDIQKMLGLLSYYKSIEPEFVRKVLKTYGAKFNIGIEEKAKKLITQL